MDRYTGLDGGQQGLLGAHALARERRTPAAVKLPYCHAIHSSSAATSPRDCEGPGSRALAT